MSSSNTNLLRLRRQTGMAAASTSTGGYAGSHLSRDHLMGSSVADGTGNSGVGAGEQDCRNIQIIGFITAAVTFYYHQQHNYLLRLTL